MKKLFLVPLFLFSLAAMAACFGQDSACGPVQKTVSAVAAGGEEPGGPVRAAGGGKKLVAYFSAQGHTQAVAERIAELTGADVYRIEAAESYAANPYHDSDRVQKEAYNDLRPGVADLPGAETIERYDTIFVGSPIWWHQPAMVVCTFLEAYDLKDKVIIPFFTYGAASYLNESMQKVYAVTPASRHIPRILPEDLDPDDITVPGRPDDVGIDMPGDAEGTQAWLRRIGIIE